MALVVQKYGGSSLRSPSHIRTAAQRIAQTKRSGTQVVVVVSAMGRATDFLIRLARRTVQQPAQRELDMLMTAGERVSMALMAMALEELGVPAISFTGSQSGILTTDHHNDARIVDIRPIRIEESLSRGLVPIVAGFQGVSSKKEVTTLGRGGSDTTAVALAAKLGADQCEVFTDVDGLFTADPRIVPSARLLKSLSFATAIEMAERGAKMHPRSLLLAGRYGVKVRIASNQAQEGEGTLVEETGMEEARFQAVATKDGFEWFRVRGEGWLNLLEGLNPAAVAVNHDGFEAVIDCAQAERLTRRLAQSSLPHERREKLCMVSVVGTACRAALYAVLDNVRTRGWAPLMVETTPQSIAMIFPESEKTPIARHLHTTLIDSKGT